MKNYFAIVFNLFILFPISISAQFIEIKEEVTESYTMDHNTGFMRSNSFSKIMFRLEGDSKFKGIGITGNRLREHIITDSEALKELNKFKKRKIAGISSGVVSVISLGLFAAANFSSTASNPNNKLAGKEYMFVGVGFGLASTITWFSAKGRAFKAIEIYNGNKFKRENKDRGSLLLNFDVIGYQNDVEKSSTIGLGAKLTF